MKPITITIDGPAGSGKGTTARGVADMLGYVYIDSGAMYRAITHHALEHNIKQDDERLETLLKEIELGITPEWEIVLNGKTLGDELRTRTINEYVSTVFARIQKVRDKVTTACQKIIEEGGYVLDGRDASTVIAPEAELKVYLDADPYERARRRAAEFGDETGAKIEEILHEVIIPRDEADKYTLAASRAKGIVVDTTALTPEEQIAKVYDLAMNIINQ